MAKITTRVAHTFASIPTRKRVAAYARVSVDSQELMESLSAQVSYYSTHIQGNHAWEYAGVYADAGISGTDINRRAEFQRLIADCNAGRIDIILTKSISRFARNTVDLLKTVRHLKERSISVRFERGNIDLLSPDGKLMLPILASYAQEKCLSARTSSGTSVSASHRDSSLPTTCMDIDGSSLEIVKAGDLLGIQDPTI